MYTHPVNEYTHPVNELLIFFLELLTEYLFKKKLLLWSDASNNQELSLV